MFWLRNKKNNFQLHTLIWRPVVCINDSHGESSFFKFSKQMKPSKKSITILDYLFILIFYNILKFENNSADRTDSTIQNGISGLIKGVYIYVCMEVILDSILKIGYNYGIIFLYLHIWTIIYSSALNVMLKRLVCCGLNKYFHI